MTARKLLSIGFLAVCIMLQGNVLMYEGTVSENEESVSERFNNEHLFDCEYKGEFCNAIPNLQEKPLETEPSVNDPLQVAKPDSLKFEPQTGTGSWFNYLIRWISLVIEMS